jgi:hypothetical protein
MKRGERRASRAGRRVQRLLVRTFWAASVTIGIVLILLRTEYDEVREEG